MDASKERLRIVSGVLNLDIIGVSMSSAELSKNERTVLSAVRKTMKKISNIPSEMYLIGMRILVKRMALRVALRRKIMASFIVTSATGSRGTRIEENGTYSTLARH